MKTNPGLTQEYKKALTEYNKEIRKSRRRDWKNTCENIESIPAASRLHKALAKDHCNGLGSMKDANGILTKNPKETLKIMLNSHFPGSCVVREDDHDLVRTNPSSGTNKEETLALSKKIFTRPKIDWAISSFNPNKASGEDGIFPVLIQQAKDILITPLCNIFTTCLTLGYMP